MRHSSRRGKLSRLLSAIVLLSASCSDHPIPENEFQSREVIIADTTYAYRVYVPLNRDPASKVPVLLYLHGSGVRGDDNVTQLADWPTIIRENSEWSNFLIVFPQCRSGRFWAGEMNQMALAALDNVVTEFNGDEQRLYLAGFSMGANGTWQNGLVHPGKFAALVPIAGNVAPGQALSPAVLDSLPPRLREAATAADPYQSFAEALRDKPIWIFHGDADDAVPVTESRRVAAALKEVGNEHARYTEYENTGHGIIRKVLSERELAAWLLSQKLRKSPDTGM